eukprot:9055036-Heterocapsa_arctica.AAC.1
MRTVDLAEHEAEEPRDEDVVVLSPKHCFLPDAQGEDQECAVVIGPRLRNPVVDEGVEPLPQPIGRSQQ